MKSVFTSIILCLLTLSAIGQSVQIRGLLQDESGEPVAYATVALKSMQDSSLVKAAVTDLDGTFVISTSTGQSLWAEISFVGYETLVTEAFSSEQTGEIHLGVLTLEEKAEELEEVVVKATKPMVEIQPDKTVFNIEDNVSAAGSDGLELLRKAPGVVLDNNDQVILQGKQGVRVFINGKPSPLRGDDLTNYLRSLQAEEIEAIEIITNPSAKYEAEGNAGIINIRLRKNRNAGANATLTSSYRVGVYSKYRNGISFNYRNEKINTYGSYNHGIGQWTNFMKLYREQSGNSFDQISRMINDPVNHRFRGGMDFFVNDKSTIGVLVEGYNNDDVFKNNSSTDIASISSQRTEQILDATNRVDSKRNNLNFNLNYAFDNKEGVSLSIDADYGRFRNDGVSYQPNLYMDPSRSEVIRESIFSAHTPTEIDIYTFKADYTRPLAGGTLGAGVKTSYVFTDNTFDFFDILQGEEIRNQELSNQFQYGELVNAAYMTWQRQAGKWNLMAGLRVEHTDSKGELFSVTDQPVNEVDLNYLNLFPSLGVTWAVNDVHALRFNYGRRLDRPNYQDLNPFEFKLDELTFEKGNAFLNPQYTNSVSLTHTYKHTLNTTLSYSVTNDLITRITDTLNSNATFITFVNLDQQRTLSLSVSYPFSIAKWWQVYANVTASRTRNQASFEPGKIIDISATTANVYGQNSFLLPGGYKLELSGWYNAPSLWGGNFRMDGIWSMDLGLQKKILKDRASLKLALTDVFKTNEWHGVSEFGGLYLEVNGGYESRQFRATFTYDLGNNQIKGERKRKTGLEDEKNRIKE